MSLPAVTVSEKETQEASMDLKRKQANKQTNKPQQQNQTKNSHNNNNPHPPTQINKQTNSITLILPLLWSSHQGLSFLFLPFFSPLTFRLFLAIEILLLFTGRINSLGFILL